MNAILEKDILTETVKDEENLINKLAWKFCRSFGGRFEDIQAEANLLFVEAYNHYDETKAKLSTWLYHYIWGRLKNTLRKNRIHCYQLPDDRFDEDDAHLEVLLKEPASPFFELMDSASDDVRDIIQLALFPPAVPFTDKDFQMGTSYCKARVELRSHLRNLGWTWDRIKESFTEIREILNG